ncbi:MAG: hypothetical protein KC731_37235 [Myxococcales bacterium]|nr:hypothetical protein [Myxococcales bacterium]
MSKQDGRRDSWRHITPVPESASHRRVVDLSDPGVGGYLVDELSRQVEAAVRDAAPYLPHAIMDLRRHLDHMRAIITGELGPEEGPLAPLNRSAESALQDAVEHLDELERSMLRGGWPDPLPGSFEVLAARTLEQVRRALARTEAYLLEGMMEHFWLDLE